MSIMDFFFGKRKTRTAVKSSFEQEKSDELREKKEYEENLIRAKEGDAEAQLDVGKYCKKYISYREAFEWFDKAAAQDFVEAYVELGHCYDKGNGVAVDKEKAFECFSYAAYRGNVDGFYWCAEIYYNDDKRKDIAKAFRYYKKAAEMGDTVAQVKVGNLYLHGEGTQKNEKEAFHWFYKSVIENGDYWWGGYQLARCYLYGIGTEKNGKAGFRILKKIIDEGCNDIFEAEKLLCTCYEDGIGTKRNRAEAKRLNTMTRKKEERIKELAQMITLPEDFEDF